MSYTTKREIFAQSNTWVLDLARAVLSNIEYFTQPIRIKLEDELGEFNDSDAYLAQIAIGLEPEPFGLAHVYQCIPYSNPKLFRQDFEGAVKRGWLEIAGDGIYRTTDKGLCYQKYLNREIRKELSKLRPLPMMQLERLDAILQEIIDAISETTIIDYKPAFDMDLKLAPTAPSTLQKICCKLAHLMAFRDDAYLNAWMEQDINSYVWEAFSYIYKGDAQTASGLAQELEIHRQYDEHTYSAALEELTARGWIKPQNGKYEPTVEGLKILAEVARTMTQYFFEPWAFLEEEKVNKLKILLEALVGALKSPRVKRWHGHASTSRNFGWRSAQWVRDKVR